MDKLSFNNVMAFKNRLNRVVSRDRILEEIVWIFCFVFCRILLEEEIFSWSSQSSVKADRSTSSFSARRRRRLCFISSEIPSRFLIIFLGSFSYFFLHCSSSSDKPGSRVSTSKERGEDSSSRSPSKDCSSSLESCTLLDWEWGGEASPARLCCSALYWEVLSWSEDCKSWRSSSIRPVSFLREEIVARRSLTTSSFEEIWWRKKKKKIKKKINHQ